ncbi:xylose isomerase-like protein [Artomyces pyxidatus]|uniref:Xylose isomerase-like protein n=1 Tax=Artomyces pyxidatus TaxID=48021 RepID=A0ACB8T6V3_9AGAM|nr:xylose isomerase-like protein [Artomyces pyxidatus]
MSAPSIPICYATPSAGMHPSHTLAVKLRAIAASGFKLTEIAFPDLEAYAAQQYPGYRKLDNLGRGDLECLCAVADEIRALFSEFEGYMDVKKREEGFDRAHAWFRVLGVGSSDDPSSSSDLEIIARDLRQLADEAAAQDPPIRLAYEMWAWGVHVNTWEGTWEVCKRVNRPNFGLCLDTFQICARAYADPTTPSGCLPSASDTLSTSLQTLAKTVPPSKIFYLQISDGSGKISPDALLRTAEEQGIPPLYAWSNAWRPLPYMDEVAKANDGYGGYLPVLDVVEAVLNTGWRGPWSYEVFYEEDMAREDTGVPRKWTDAARAVHELILKKLQRRGF